MSLYARRFGLSLFCLINETFLTLFTSKHAKGDTRTDLNEQLKGHERTAEGTDRLGTYPKTPLIDQCPLPYCAHTP